MAQQQRRIDPTSKQVQNTPQAECARTPLWPDRRIGEYSILCVLDEDPQGIRYLARDFILGDMVQIREFFPVGMALRAGDEQTPDLVQPLEGMAAQFKYFRACFQDLYNTLRQDRDNECLLPILQILELNATVYVVSEYRPMKTLTQHLCEVGGHESWCRAKKYLLPLYNSLSNLHKAGIIHQSISPENILLDEQMRPYWREFALSEMHSQQEVPLVPGYAAPEQVEPGGWSGVWTDVYAIAAVSYKVLTGLTPPDALSREKQDTLRPANEVDPHIEQNISQALWDAMRLPPNDRCDSVSALTGRMLDSESSNTMVFQVDSDVTEKTVHLDSLKGNFVHQEPAEREESQDAAAARPERRGGIYLVVTMAATLLVLAVGLPQLLRISPWDSFAAQEEPAATGSDNVVQLQSNTPVDEEHTVDTFIGRRAQSVLENKNYEQWYNFQTEEVYNEEFAQGFVVDQSLDPGETITRRTGITLYVSKGSQMEQLPNLVGQTAEQAIATLEGMNKRYQLVEGSSDTVQAGQVFRTDPAAGTEMKKDENDLVILYVARQEEQTEQAEQEEDGVQVLSQKNSDRKVIKKNNTSSGSTDSTDSSDSTTSSSGLGKAGS